MFGKKEIIKVEEVAAIERKTEELFNESSMHKTIIGNAVEDLMAVNRVIKEDTVEICEFYVEPFFKGKGIGKELIQQVIFEARMSKKTKIFLWVIEDNLSARKFYENNGFIASGETCLIEGTTKTDMCYEMIL